MSKITIANKDFSKAKVRSVHIGVGTVFTGSIEFASRDSLFLAAYNANKRSIPLIIDLQDISKTWDNEVSVANYSEVDITITINKKGEENE